MSWAVIGGAIASIASTIGSGAAAAGSAIGAAGSAIGSGAAGLFGSGAAGAGAAGAGAGAAGAAGAAGTMPGIFAAAPAAAEALTAGGAGMSFAPMASGAAAAAPAAATGGGLQGLLSGLFQSGAGPTQLSGPGVASNAPVGAAAGSGEAAGAGGFDFGNWLTQVNPQQIGTNFNKGGMAGQRDFRGLEAVRGKEAEQANLNQRTAIVQKQFESQQADQAKKDAANAAIGKIFEKPGALDAGNLSKSLAEMLPHLFAGGNTAGASGVFNLLTKAQEDEKTNSAMGIAGYIAQKNTQPDGTFDWANARKELNTLGNAHVMKMFDTAIVPAMREQRLSENADRGTAGTRDLVQLLHPTAKSIDDLNDTQKQNILAIKNASPGVREQLIAEVQKNPNAPLDMSKAMKSSDERKVNVSVNIAGQGAYARETGAENAKAANMEKRLSRITKEAEAANAGKPLDAGISAKVSDLFNFRKQVVNVEQNLDSEFLGPVKGTQGAFEARRRVGSYLGSPVGAQETVFRQALSDMADMLLRARSGAQINEQEYKRLSGLLPKATDEEGVFRAGLARIDNDARELMANKIRLGTTPKGKLTETGKGNTNEVIKLERDPKTGKLREVKVSQ